MNFIALWTTLIILWGNSWWSSGIHKAIWRLFGVIFRDFWCTLKLLWSESQWFGNVSFEVFLATLSQSCWLLVDFLQIVWTILKLFWGNSCWLAINSEISLAPFWVILGDSRTTLKFHLRNCWWFWLFTNHTEITLGWFLIILRDYQWFMTNSEFFGGNLGWFSVIYISIWNFLGEILCDSWKNSVF